MNAIKVSIQVFTTVFSLHLFGQSSDSVATLDFCGETLNIPAGCEALSESELKCDDFVIQWLYMNDLMLKSMPNQFVRQLENRLKKFSKKPIRCSSLGSTLDGYKISYKEKREVHYKIIAYGRVNQRPVLINLTLNNNPVNNDALPSFAQQIITLK